METIDKYAQGLVYSLHMLDAKRVYQKTSLNALLGLFLDPLGHPLPQHTQVKSASSPSSISKPLWLVYSQRHSDDPPNCFTANCSTSSLPKNATAGID